MKIVAITKVSARPDLYGLQLQLMRRYAPGLECIALYSPPRMSRDRSAETAEVCSKYGAEFMQLPKVDHSEHWRQAVAIANRRNADRALIVEDDLIPVAPLILDWQTFGRTNGGALTKQLRYIDPRAPDERPAVCIEATRGTDRATDPMVQEIEWLPGWFHYDRGSAFTFSHELAAKDAIANAIAVEHGAEPFAVSCGVRMELSAHHLERLGELARTMTTRQISVAMRGGPMPGAVTQLSAFSRAVIAAAKANRRMVDAGTLATRKAICGDCEHHSGSRCTLCGCNLSAKQRLATESCPAKKWGIVHDKTKPTPTDID